MKLSSVKRTAVAGVAALTLVGASLGVVAAQQAPTAPGQASIEQQSGQQQPGDRQQHQQFLAALAARLGISTDQLQQAMDQARADVGMPDRGPGGGPDGGDHRPGGGPNGEGHRQGGSPGGGDQQRMGGGLDAAAQTLGISVDQLRQELQGQTLAQVAQAHNVDPATVADALKQAAYARIDQAAAAGQMPNDQVDAAKQRVSDRVDQMLSQTVPSGRSAEGGPADRGPGGWGPGGRAARDGGPGASR